MPLSDSSVKWAYYLNSKKQTAEFAEFVERKMPEKNTESRSQETEARIDEKFPFAFFLNSDS
jgi:hypothetical protein